MQEIVDSVRRVTGIMHEIAEASGEQSMGIQEIGQAVGQMDEMTQQNAALVEQAAAAAESLEEQAEHLAAVLDVFKLSHQTAASMEVTAYKPGAIPNAGLKYLAP
jgi:methyl-accepting chemotaxis protein